MVKTISTGYKPHAYQVEIHANLSKNRFGVVVCHRRFGKTVGAVNSLIDAALRFRGGDGRYGYLAPFYGQAKKVAWDYFKKFTHMIGGIRYNESELTVFFPNGSQIKLYGADNPDALRGIYLDGVVLDEVADMKSNVWGEVLRPALADRNGWGLFIGTPKGINLFYELYQYAKVTEGWFTAKYGIEETRLLPDDEIQVLKKELTINQYAQEMLCDFGASSDDILIPISLAIESTRREIHPVNVKGSFRCIGVDVARYGNDKSVIFKREGLLAYEPIVFDDISNVDLANEVIKHIDEFNPEAVNVDGGRGEGVIDTMRSLRYRVNEIQFGATQGVSNYYRNKRAEMWDNMRKWMTAGGCIPDNSVLMAELSAQPFTMQNDTFSLISKEKMRKDGIKSPDLADALALTFAVKRPLSNNAYAQTIKKSGGGLRTRK